MRTFKDDRSRSYCDVFPAVTPGDINISVMYPGTIKAFHRHKKQTDHWFLAKGNVRVVCVRDTTTPITEFMPDTLSKIGTTIVLPGPKATLERLREDYHGKGDIVSVYKHEMSDDPDQYSTSLVRYDLKTSDVQVTYLSEGESLIIPPGVWHGVQVLGNEEAILAYHITNKYNPSDPDEERAEWNAFYSWEISKK